ncbi:Rieske (2Fe-2S) protein [Microlunatus sp. Gsoil 973]|jgi:Rieske Fe-S protein|uniref:Rieske (2Fe-2S) protein n=1 Tax=Microlunatus sp. Gsoil 973 TaxID=2672569 RepID=UPI0012B4B581|nr:Rieske (2Fe-2S) protein [Microlunatus sp. Gsoil 973]QGN31956.1 Rieske 2Fe-2S domain-containing protein [Microlunatus sp. Gsoil 973]
MIDAFLKVSATGSRRDLFRSVGLVALGGGSAAVLAACSGSGSASGGDTPTPSGPLTIAKSDVPVRSGVIKDGFIVTQPSANNYKAFSNICTHQGCPITDLRGDTIMCNCHGSEFNIDGTVKRGPANRPLTAAKLSVDGANLDVSS